VDALEQSKVLPEALFSLLEIDHLEPVGSSTLLIYIRVAIVTKGRSKYAFRFFFFFFFFPFFFPSFFLFLFLFLFLFYFDFLFLPAPGISLSLLFPPIDASHSIQVIYALLNISRTRVDSRKFVFGTSADRNQYLATYATLLEQTVFSQFVRSCLARILNKFCQCC
jgi:hypothetical protein